MTLKAASPSATCFAAGCQSSCGVPAYDMIVLKFSSALVMSEDDQSALAVHSALYRSVPSVPSSTLSSRWTWVHWEPIDSGIFPVCLTFSSAPMNSSIVFGGPETPASFSTPGLYQSTFDRWMLTGTE